MAIQVTGKFATPEDTAEILGVSPARTKRLVAMVDGILAEQGGVRVKKAVQSRVRTAKVRSAKRRTHGSKVAAAKRGTRAKE